ncbi:hypothetical protein EV138_6005 [Kribbella voronezhensis]|uniref:Uncharacterized protein n=1 Tax=Kribbella voronezhensis TaxID=2512212 RepID=A0A4R7SWD8_9ACTN|nr:hypothetical protein [Kribbella voronezhensis]TDU83541.1 hypothetical protein EV138_6005 [Kribbella voronezhensis]
MSFLNLPPDWSESPLSDTTLAADVVDLCVSAGDRRLGLFKAIFCDQEDRFRGGVDISLRDRHGQLHLTDCRTVLEPLVAALSDHPDLGVLLALGRPGPESWPAVDNQWAELSADICNEAGVRLLAFYVASADHIRRVEAPVNV